MSAAQLASGAEGISALNAAFYCFTPLADLPAQRREWHNRLAERGLKGTVILAPEGVNGSLAGPPSAVRAALMDLRTLPGLGTLNVKESFSPAVPFARLRVKVKKEIVTFGPVAEAPSSFLDPQTLAAWLDEDRDLVLLDTRNRFESRIGTFEGAEHSPIDHFVEFAAAAKAFPAAWKEKPVVTFCTGGIRCEKAAPFLSSLGFRHVYQLRSGILGYFEEVGGRHWRGECFVFDERVALGPDLAPSGARLCAECGTPVLARESACPACGAA